MIRKYSKIFFWILLAAVMILSFIFWDKKYVPEFFVILMYSAALSQFFNAILQKTNSKRIVIKTKSFNWGVMIIWIILGVLKLQQKQHFDLKLIFGFLTVYKAYGIGCILIGLASFPRNIIIDNDGIKLNGWLKSTISYNESFQIILSNTKLKINIPDLTYRYKIFKLTDDEIEIINKRIEAKRTI